MVRSNEDKRGWAFLMVTLMFATSIMVFSSAPVSGGNAVATEKANYNAGEQVNVTARLSSTPNLIANGDFENGITGWTEYKYGAGTYPYSIETNETNYLHLSKDWWGYHRFNQTVGVTTTDLMFSAKIRAINIPVGSVEGAYVSIEIRLKDSSDNDLGMIGYYISQYVQNATGPTLYQRLLGNTPVGWLTINANIKDITQNYMTGVDLTKVSKVLISLLVYHGEIQATATGDFDDISITYATPNLVVNGDFENGITGWNRLAGTTTGESGTYTYTVETTETKYLRVNKNWWGYHIFNQDINVTTADLLFSAKMRPTSIPATSGSRSIVMVSLSLYGSQNNLLGGAEYYYSQYFNYASTSTSYEQRLGTTSAGWNTISFNVKDLFQKNMPSVSLTDATKVRIALYVYHGETQATATGDFDDVSLTYATPNLVVNGDFDNGITGWSRAAGNGPGESGTYIYTVETTETNYLRVNKNWWGYHSFTQVINVTTADLLFSAKMRPTSIPTVSGSRSKISLFLAVSDAQGNDLGGVEYYYSQYFNYASTSTWYEARLGTTSAGWNTISFNVKDFFQKNMPSVSLASASKITIQFLVYHGETQATATGDFDDISLRYVNESTRIESAKLPSARVSASTIWDGSNAYIFSGYYYDGTGIFYVLDQIVKFNPSTGTVTTLSAKFPSARYGTSAIWDGTNAYIFGGYTSSSYLDQIIKFNPSTGIATTLDAKLPSARAYTSAIWDGTNAYIFGGYTGSSYLDQIIKFNPTTGDVTILSAKLPIGRLHTSAMWDGMNVYLFGGSVGSGSFSDQILKFNPSTGTVTTLSAKLPSTRYYTTTIWDGTNGYIFGGSDGTNVFDQIVKFDPTTGSATTLSAKLLTSGASAVWDGTNGYIFGGGSGSSYSDQIVKFYTGIGASNKAITFEVYKPDQTILATYTAQKNSTGVAKYTFTLPSDATMGMYRVSASGDGLMASTNFDVVVPKNLPDAPTITTTPYTDIDGSYSINWTTSAYAITYILEENGVVIYNGTNQTYSFMEKSVGNYAYRIRAWNTNGTSNLGISNCNISVVSTKLPSARVSASTIWDGSNAYIFSGYYYDGTGIFYVLDQIVKFNPSTGTVTTLSAKFPSARYGTSAIWDGTNAYIFGGYTSSSYLDQIIKFNPSTGIATTLDAKLPSARAYTSAIWDGTNAYIFGGYTGSSYLDQIIKFNPTTGDVTILSAKLPIGRLHTSAMWDGMNVYLFGGSVGSGSFSDQILKFNPSTGTVTTLSAKLPSTRYYTTTIWDGTNGYIFGGSDGTNVFDQIVKFDPTTGSATTLSAKLLTSGASAVWDGTNGYIFGGGSGSSYSDQIAKFTPSTSSVTIVVDTTKQPGIPTIATAAYTNTDDSYDINWTTSAYADRYILDENGVEAYNGTTLTCSFTGKSDGTYMYRVKAWNVNGTSDWSTCVTVIINNAKLPGTSSITTASYTDTDGSYNINWTTSIYAARYILEENGVEVYNGTNTLYSFTDKADGAYSYRIRAWNVNGTSDWSSALAITVFGPKLPGTPIITTSPYTDNVGSYSVNWTLSTYANRYSLEENGVEIYNSTALSYSLTGKADGSYTYRVKAWNTNGTSDYSSSVIVTVSTVKPPGMPTITTVGYTDIDGNYSINWTTSAYADRYILEENGIEIYNGTALTYSFTNKLNGTYTYRVKAWNTNGASTWSFAVGIVVGDSKLPGTPPITTVSSIDIDGNYDISWLSVVYATNYSLEENNIEIYNGTALVYTFTSKPDGAYIYRVKAWNANGTSSWSSPILIVVDVAKLPGATDITTLAYTDTDGSYSINWTTSAYTTKYVLEENGVEIYNGTAPSYSPIGKADDPYAYRAKAWNTNGTSNWSSIVTITVDNAKMPGIPMITTTAHTDTDGAYSINWGTSTYATRYVLEENAVEIYNGTDLTQSFTNKTDGTYTYRVKAWNANGTSSWSSSVGIAVDVIKFPEATDITTLAYTDTDGSYSINWTTSAYAAKYVLEENSIEICNTTALTYSPTGKLDGSYTYRVKVWNANGTSNWSATLTIVVDNTKLPCVPAITTTAPYPYSGSSYSIAWTASASATKYILEENGAETYNGTNLVCSFTDKLDGTYNYTVRAWNANGTSNRSSPMLVIRVFGPKIPSVPIITTLSYTDIDGLYSINWTTSSYAAKYLLEENGVDVYNGTILAYSFANKADGNYYYRIKAWNGNGASNWSASVIVTVTNVPDLAVLGIFLSPIAITNGDTVTITVPIKNLGTAQAYSANVVVRAIEQQSNTTQDLYTDIKILDVAPFSSTVVSTQWSAKTGNYTITAYIGNTTPAEVTLQNNQMDAIAVVSTPQTIVGTIFGEVRDSRNAALDNATIYIGSKQSKTNQSGGFVLSNVPVGLQIITASKTGYKTIELYRNVTESLQQISIVLPATDEDDTGLPYITISRITNNTIVTNKTVNVSGTVYDKYGIKKVQISTDGTSWLSVNGIEDWYAFVTVESGLNTVYIKVTDASNNTNITSVRIIVQDVIPSVDTNGIGRELSQDIPFKFNATDSEQTIVIMAPEDNGTDIAVGGVSVPYGVGDTKRYDTNGNGQDDLSITLILTNKTAGTAIVSIKSLDEDFEKPGVIITSHKDKDQVNTAKIRLEGVASDNKGVAKVEISTDNKTWVLANGTVSWNAEVNLSKGKNTIYVKATDLFGNTETFSMEITMDEEKKKESRGFIPAAGSPVIIATVGLLAVAAAFFRRRNNKRTL
ncbi:MAG: kelch repeat-containing protein [Thermoplasmata archaeon]